MSHKGAARLCWNVRYKTNCAYAERVLAETLATSQQLLFEHLPASAGYETRCVRLSGSLQGLSLAGHPRLF